MIEHDENTIREVMKAMGKRGGAAKTTKLKGLAAVSEKRRKAISAAGVAARKNKRKIVLDNL